MMIKGLTPEGIRVAHEVLAKYTAGTSLQELADEYTDGVVERIQLLIAIADEFEAL